MGLSKLREIGTLLRKGGDEAITLGGKQFSVDDFYKGFNDVNSPNSQAFRAEFVQEAAESLQNGTLTRNGLGNALDEIQGVITTGFRERNPNLSRADHARIVQNQMDALEGAVNDAMKPARTPNTSPNRNAPVLDNVGEDLNTLAGKAGGELTPDKFLDGIKYDSSLVYNDKARGDFAQEMAKGFKTQNYFGDVVPTAENIANTARETYTTAINRSLISNPGDLPSGFRSPAEYIESDVFAAQADNFANDVAQRYNRSVNTPTVETGPAQKSEAVEVAEINADAARYTADRNVEIAELNNANRTSDTTQQVVDEAPPVRQAEAEAEDAAANSTGNSVDDQINTLAKNSELLDSAANLNPRTYLDEIGTLLDNSGKFNVTNTFRNLRKSLDANDRFLDDAPYAPQSPKQVWETLQSGGNISEGQFQTLRSYFARHHHSESGASIGNDASQVSPMPGRNWMQSAMSGLGNINVFNRPGNAASRTAHWNGHQRTGMLTNVTVSAAIYTTTAALLANVTPNPFTEQDGDVFADTTRALYYEYFDEEGQRELLAKDPSALGVRDSATAAIIRNNQITAETANATLEQTKLNEAQQQQYARVRDPSISYSDRALSTDQGSYSKSLNQISIDARQAFNDLSITYTNIDPARLHQDFINVVSRHAGADASLNQAEYDALQQDTAVKQVFDSNGVPNDRSVKIRLAENILN